MSEPLISILIPTRNRKARLLRTLESLRAQSAAPGTCEIVVVSDGSTDGTRQAVNELASSPRWSNGGPQLHCLEQEWRGASAARNTALRAAKAELVLMLDDDVDADAGLVAAHVAAHGEAAAGEHGTIVLGHIMPHERPEALHRQMRLWWDDHFRRLAQRPPAFTAFFTGNVSLPRQAALDVGGLDESLTYGEDVEFGYRLCVLGLRLRYEPLALAYTENIKPAKGLLSDLFNSGRAAVQTYRKFPETLGSLALSAYGETNIRMRLARGLLLKLSVARPLAWLIDRAFALWAGSRRETGLERQLFELARGYYFWRGVRAELGSGGEWSRFTSAGVPVLTYHSVAPLRGRRLERYRVGMARFRLQMVLLKLLGYRVVTLDSLVRDLKQGQLPPRRAVALTFDDGYVDNLRYAWPIIRRLGYRATLFLVTGLAGGSNEWDHALGAEEMPLLTWDQAALLDREGFSIESHSVHHPDLAKVPLDEARFELVQSRRQLEEHLGRPARYIAYPYGHYTPEVAEAAERAGYDAAFSVERGLNTLRTARFGLRRVTISGDDSLLMFVLKLWTGDDPLRYVPRLGGIAGRKWGSDVVRPQRAGTR